jgi:bifunctional non-homologous end joining protein LigD
MTTRTYGNRQVELSNLDKVLFPTAGLTKGDLIDYYERVADVMVPHMKGRPLSLQRFPDGVDGEGFYQKETPDYFPDWITTASVPLRGEGGSQSQVICDDKATLVYLADQACITPHVWLSRHDRLDVPDRMIFDLDPPGDDFAAVRDVARRLRDLLEELGLKSRLMLTGSRGAHVVVSLRRGPDFDEVRSLAQNIAGHLADARPEEITIAQRKKKRGARLFLDTARNAYGQTTVAPYAVRARPEATVAAPLEWDELGASDLSSSRYTIKNIFRRLSQKEDPWSDIGRGGASIGGATDKLERLREEN